MANLSFKLASVACALLLCGFMTACNVAPVEKRSVSAAVDLKVKDPFFRRLTAVTENIKIDAHGELKPGRYEVNGHVVRVNSTSQFSLKLDLPIKNPDLISSKDADGELSTLGEVSVDGVSLPQKLNLKNGTVAGEVDFARTLGVFLCNVVQEQARYAGESHGLQEMCESVSIDSASLNMRPGSSIKWGADDSQERSFNLAAGSCIELKNLAVRDDLSYEGQCELLFKFNPGSSWATSKMQFQFNGGQAAIKLAAKRSAAQLTLTATASDQKFVLTDCTYRFGKNERSSANCQHVVVDLEQLSWTKRDGDDRPSYRANTKLGLSDTHLDVKTDVHETVAFFPHNTPAELDVQSDGHDVQTHFSTLKSPLAQTATVTISRPNTAIKCNLRDADVGEVSFDKSGDLGVFIGSGKAKLVDFYWTNSKRTFKLVTSGDSTITLPQGMTILKTQNKKGVKLSMPVDVAFSTAALSGTTGMIKLKDVRGSLMLNIDPEVSIASSLDFIITESELFGRRNADVTVKGLDLTSSNGQSVAHLKGCSVSFTKNDLEDAISEQIPKEKVFKLKQVILADQKWRYKNAVITQVKLHDLKLDEFKQMSKNQADFTASGAMDVDGTVDKGKLFASASNEDAWHSCPWSASADVQGSGSVKYSFVPKGCLADSAIKYDLAINIGMPQDIKLDWSQVSSGILKSAERAVIVSQMKKAQAFKSGAAPICCSGSLALFHSKSRQLQCMKLKELSTRPVAGGTELDFVGDAVF